VSSTAGLLVETKQLYYIIRGGLTLRGEEVVHRLAFGVRPMKVAEQSHRPPPDAFGAKPSEPVGFLEVAAGGECGENLCRTGFFASATVAIDVDDGAHRDLLLTGGVGGDPLQLRSDTLRGHLTAGGVYACDDRTDDGRSNEVAEHPEQDARHAKLGADW
jgi:hypothetical protein